MKGTKISSKPTVKALEQTRKNSSLKPLPLTLNNFCLINTLRRLFQFRNNNSYIGNTKTQEN